jgi:hypothetical protein
VRCGKRVASGERLMPATLLPGDHEPRTTNHVY